MNVVGNNDRVITVFLFVLGFAITGCATSFSRVAQKKGDPGWFSENIDGGKGFLISFTGKEGVNRMGCERNKRWSMVIEKAFSKAKALGFKYFSIADEQNTCASSMGILRLHTEVTVLSHESMQTKSPGPIVDVDLKNNPYSIPPGPHVRLFDGPPRPIQEISIIESNWQVKRIKIDGKSLDSDEVDNYRPQKIELLPGDHQIEAQCEWYINNSLGNTVSTYSSKEPIIIDAIFNPSVKYYLIAKPLPQHGLLYQYCTVELSTNPN